MCVLFVFLLLWSGVFVVFVVFFALISAARKSSLDKFDPRLRFLKSNGVLFEVPGLTKCPNQNKPIERVF